MRAFESADFRSAFTDLLIWRRDVRRFSPEPLSEAVMAALFDAALLAPSVGLSQPSRFTRVRDPANRAAVRSNFERCNAAALAGYDGADAALYARLKLSGLGEAPEQVAVFSDRATSKGRGLGRATMPETLDYSVVVAVHAMWLAARTWGLGLGWVSILDPAEIARLLRVPAEWKLIAYLCIGSPSEESREPELERAGWEKRCAEAHTILER